MASWRQPDQEGLGPGWGRPSFNRDNSVRHIAPGLMARDNYNLPPPQESFYSASELQSTSDGYNTTMGKAEDGGHDRALDPALDNGLGEAYNGQPGNSGKKPSRITKKRILIALAILLFILIVAVVIPVAVVVSRRNQSAEAPSTSEQTGSPPAPGGTGPGPAPAPSSAPEIGAIKGSGIGAAEFGDPSIVFFQHTDGSIWQSSARGDGSTFKGKVRDGDDLRNGTPIAAVRYQAAERDVTHIAFIGKDNILRDSLQYNGTGDWENGRLETAKFEASSSDRVGLSLVGVQTDSKQFTTYPLGALTLYYGGTDGRIHEVTIVGGQSPACETGQCIDIFNPTWREKFVFPQAVNGNAGFYVGQPHENSYLVCSTTDNMLVWWKMQTYPKDAGQWTSGTASEGAKLRDNTSVALAGDTMVFYQDADDQVKAIDFNPTQDLTMAWGDIHDVARATPDTRLSGMLLDDDKTPAVILQAENNSVTQYARDGDGWKTFKVPVN